MIFSVRVFIAGNSHDNDVPGSTRFAGGEIMCHSCELLGVLLTSANGVSSKKK